MLTKINVQDIKCVVINITLSFFVSYTPGTHFELWLELSFISENSSFSYDLNCVKAKIKLEATHHNHNLSNI